MAFDEEGTPRARAYAEFPQYFPEPGWVEHDAAEIWRTTGEVLADVVATVEGAGDTVTAIGITDQRETVVVWDRRTGEPVHRAVVWQDRRTADACTTLKADGLEPLVRATTGLVLDPYFSATKLRWILEHADLPPLEHLAFGTVDSWLLYRLTGGGHGGVHATDPSNASRTMLFDIGAGAWSDTLLDVFSVPRAMLPEVRPSSGVFGTTRPADAAGLEVPVSGIAGDQQASLFGQGCFTPGMTKNTYGTGSFVLVNLGPELPTPVDGLLTTIAWELDGVTSYAMEGAIFVTGAAVQWLRDGLGLITDAAETGPLAESVPDTGGVFVVPAFAGLGAPYWDPYARGTVVGITRGTTKAHLARAVVEAMAWQTRDVVDAVVAATGTTPSEIRADGGAVAMDLLCRFQADVLGIPLRRSAVAETTALGAAYLAGLGAGVWSSTGELAPRWSSSGDFAPTPDRAALDVAYAQWRRAVDRSRDWARPVP